MATTSLSRTMTAGDRDKFTVSAWVKRGILGNRETYWGAYTDASNYTTISFDTDSTLHWDNHVSGAAGQQLPVNYFRDVGAWYHIVTVWDSANATPGDRMKIYINGDEVTSFLVDGNPSSGQDSSFGNSGSTMVLGQKGDSGSYFTGSLAHVHVCDGQAYAASDFGETDATSGIWIAKTSPSVTYGTNGGFYKFASGSTLTDSSGESNNLTLVGGTLTANKDSPDNNFATMNPLENYYANMTYTQGNLTTASDHPAPASSTIGMATGKWYIEGKAALDTVAGAGDWQIGIIGDQVVATSDEIGNHAKSWAYYGPDGNYRNNDTTTSYGDSYNEGDIIGIAIDLTNNKLYFSKNGTWQDSGDPTSGATGTGAISISAAADTPLGEYFIAVGGNASANTYTWSMNFGNGYFGTTSHGETNADDAGIGLFKYDVPAGYYALCTTNLGDQS